MWNNPDSQSFIYFITQIAQDRVLEKLMVFQLFEKFSAFYGTQEFIIILKNPVTDLFPETTESRHTLTSHFFEGSCESLPIYVYVFLQALSLQTSVPSPCLLLFRSHACHMPLTSHPP
jgi:hypothetical protein